MHGNINPLANSFCLYGINFTVYSEFIHNKRGIKNTPLNNKTGFKSLHIKKQKPKRDFVFKKSRK